MAASEPAPAPVGSNHERIIPQNELPNLSEREKFWNQEQSEEKARLEQEKTRKISERSQLERERVEREVKEAKRREAEVTERERKISVIRDQEKKEQENQEREQKKKWQQVCLHVAISIQARGGFFKHFLSLIA